MSVFRLRIANWIIVGSILSGCGGEQPATGGIGITAERGQTLYTQCRACHTLNDGELHKIGPSLYGIFGSRAGAVPGFSYSDVLVKSDVVWTVETMDAWLARPNEFLPGNRMIFSGIRDDVDRASLIAYLQQATEAQ